MSQIALEGALIAMVTAEKHDTLTGGRPWPPVSGGHVPVSPGGSGLVEGLYRERKNHVTRLGRKLRGKEDAGNFPLSTYML